MNQLLLEIGTEEIPAGYIMPALTALADNLTAKLDAARIAYGRAPDLPVPPAPSPLPDS